MYNELYHVGVLGMKWGHHKTAGTEISKHTSKLAAKDAKRHADAKMFYGKGAGTRRKLLKAEIDKKKRTVPGYEEEFNKSLSTVDYAKSAKKATITRKTKDATYRARVTTKQTLGVTGPLTVAAGTLAYQTHKREVDAFVSKQFNKIISNIMR